MIDLAELRALPVVAPSADSVTRWVPFVEVPVDVLAALTDAVEAAQAYVSARTQDVLRRELIPLPVSRQFAEAELALAHALAPFRRTP